MWRWRSAGLAVECRPLDLMASVNNFKTSGSKVQQVQFLQRRSSRLGMGADFCIWKGLLQDPWCKQVWRKARVKPVVRCRRPPLVCASLDLMLPAVSVQVKDFSLAAARSMSLGLARVVLLLKAYPVAVQIVPAVGLIVFSVWGLGPVTRQLRKFFLKKSEKTWDNSLTQLLMASYMRPILVWMGVMIICRAIDPLVLSTEASHAIKDRFVNFVRSLSTVLAFAFCTASLTQQIQRFMMERQDSQEARNVGVQFIGNTVYTSVWVAAVCLFMELLGFSTQKWITAGGFGTVLLTLAGREIFTNFLSSVMIHATRPFVESEWIQTKIEGQEVSGTVEHVGWWSPTVIRGDDREAVHIPNHKFTVSVVRNLSQKNHWRIKIHFGISHLDVNKIKHIVADMRKVLAKHPSVEQHRLHRRVFFDNIDPENQALLILVSCFVKTPHFEEYLRVKEIILLDLLKVISHHHARLATPIRSVQRVMDDNESRQSPFRDVAARTENHRPFLLVEAAPVSDQEKELVKVKTDSGEGNMSAKGPLKPTAYAAEDGAGTNPKLEAKERVLSGTELKGAGEAPSQSPAPKPQLEGLDSMGLNAGDITLLGAAFEKPPANFPEGLLDGGPYAESPQVEKVTVRTPGEKTRPKNPSEKGVLRAGEVANEQIADALAADETRKMAGDKPSPVEQGPSKDERALQNAGSETAEISDPWLASSGSSSMSEKPDHVQTNVRAGGGLADERASSVQMPQSLEENVLLGVAINGPKRTLPLDDERPTPAEQRMPSATASSSPRPQSVEDMLLLGVALDGPKRTLPLGDDKSSSTEQRELVIPRNGNGGTA